MTAWERSWRTDAGMSLSGWEGWASGASGDWPWRSHHMYLTDEGNSLDSLNLEKEEQIVLLIK